MPLICPILFRSTFSNILFYVFFEYKKKKKLIETASHLHCLSNISGCLPLGHVAGWLHLPVVE